MQTESLLCTLEGSEGRFAAPPCPCQTSAFSAGPLSPLDSKHRGPSLKHYQEHSGLAYSYFFEPILPHYLEDVGLRDTS